MVESDLEEIRELKSHMSMVDHFQRTLYFKTLDDPDLALESSSLPLIEVSVDQFCRTVHSIYHPKSNVNVRFVARLARFNCISPYSFVLALIYLERLRSKNPKFITSVPTKELLLVALLIAAKYLYDDGEEEEVFNSEFAKCSNLSLTSVNQAEQSFLNAIEWEIYVDPHQFYKQLLQIEKLITKSECKKRSFTSLTYAELRRFMNDRDLKLMSNEFAKKLLETILLISVAYAGLVVSITLSMTCLMNLKYALKVNQGLLESANHIHQHNHTWQTATGQCVDDLTVNVNPDHGAKYEHRTTVHLMSDAQNTMANLLVNSNQSYVGQLPAHTTIFKPNLLDLIYRIKHQL